MFEFTLSTIAQCRSALSKAVLSTRTVFLWLVAATILLGPPNYAAGQNITATWSPNSNFPNSIAWYIDPNPYEPLLSNWDFNTIIYPFLNYPTTLPNPALPSNLLFFDVEITEATGVFIPPGIDIAISNLSMVDGASVNLIDGSNFIIHNWGAGGGGGDGVVTGGEINLSNTLGSVLTELYLDGNVTFTGGGRVVMNDSVNNAIRGNFAFNPTARMTLDDYTVEGSGNVGTDELLITVKSGGMIKATGSAPLTIDPMDGANGVFNSGMLLADGGTLRLFDGGFDNNGGIIRANADSVVEIINSSVSRGRFESGDNGVVRAVAGVSLIGPITNDAHLQIPDTTVFLTGNLTNTNQISIGNGVAFGSLVYDSDTVLDGGGRVILSGNGTTQLNAASGSTGRLTNVDNTISGSGQIGGRFTNQGTVRANQNGTLFILPSDVDGSGINQGLMEATGPGTLNFHISTIDNNAGVVRATNGGTVSLTGSATIQGGDVNVVGASRIHLSDGTIDANINNSSQGTIASVFGSSNFLRGTINNPDGGTILVNNGTRIQWFGSGSDINAGKIKLDGDGPLAGFTGTRLMIGGTVTLTGGGEIEMTNSISNTIEGVGSATEDRLVNQDHRIHGSGSFGRGSLSIINRGIVEADQPFVDSQSFGKIFVHAGQGGLTNEGILRATNGGRMEFLNGTYNNAGGLIEATDGSSIDFNQDVFLNNGTLRTTGSGALNMINGLVTLNGINIDANTTINPIGRVNLVGDIQNQKTITIDRSSLRTFGTVNLSGGGNIVLVDSPNSSLDVFGTMIPNRLINMDNTISGGGVIRGVPIENHGTIRADGNSLLNYLVSNPGFDNQGNLEVLGAGGMRMTGGQFTTSGNVEIAAGSRLFRDGAYIQTSGSTHVDGTLEVSFGNSIQIQGGTLSGNGNIIGPAAINGLVSPGNSPGILNFTRATSLLFGINIELSGDLVDGLAPNINFLNRGTDPLFIDFDQINVLDTLTLADGLLIDIQLIDGYLPQAGAFFDILTGNAISTIGNLNFQSNAPSGYVFNHEILSLFDPIAGTNRDVLRLNVVAVPEPTYACWLMLGVVAILVRRRGRCLI